MTGWGHWIGRVMGVALVALLAAGPVTARADGLRPALAYDGSGPEDHAFNQGALRGVRRFAGEAGTAFRDLRISSDHARAVTELAGLAAAGHDPVVVVGFTLAPALAEVAPRFPATRFVIVDTVIHQPNVLSVVFRDHEGSFLAGIAAGLATRSGVVGFVGGMDSEPIRRFECGFRLGVRHVAPTARLLSAMAGDSAEAFNDPPRGRALAQEQMAAGADVIYAAAGRTGLGVLAAVAERGRLAIGVDSNQNHLHPGRILTSMLKRVDVATYIVLKGMGEGRWQPGLTVLGLSEEGVGVALDEHNALLMTDDMLTRIEEARQAIIAGRLHVHDYSADRPCPL